jgi:hypothetical protein
MKKDGLYVMCSKGAKGKGKSLGFLFFAGHKVIRG